MSLHEKEMSGHISSIKVRVRSLVITHLLFADDCYIFSRVKMDDIKVIQECLCDFSKASGQVINQEKSELYYSSNTPRHSKRVVQGVISMKNSQSLGNYLGLSSSIGRKKSSLFAFIEKRTR